MKIIATQEFERRYKDLPKAIRRKAEKQEKIFQKDLSVKVLEQLRRQHRHQVRQPRGDEQNRQDHT